jgi:phosphoglycolate phosphatase
MTVPERPAAVLFDWDNTLVDSWAVIQDALNHTLAAMRHPPWSLDQVKARVRHSLANSFPALFGDDWPRARQLYLDRFEAIHLDRIRPLDGAAAQLAELREAGTYLAVVSNKTGRLLRREVAALGWDGYFARVVGAGDAAADKPSRLPIDLALGGGSIAAGEGVWYVGDTEIDVECALNAGCIPVLVHGAGQAAEPLARYCFTDLVRMAEALRPSGVL